MRNIMSVIRTLRNERIRGLCEGDICLECGRKTEEFNGYRFDSVNDCLCERCLNEKCAAVQFVDQHAYVEEELLTAANRTVQEQRETQMHNKPRARRAVIGEHKDRRASTTRDWSFLEANGWMFEPLDPTYRPRAQSEGIRRLCANRGLKVTVRIADDDNGTAGYLVEVI